MQCRTDLYFAHGHIRFRSKEIYTTTTMLSFLSFPSSNIGRTLIKVTATIQQHNILKSALWSHTQISHTRSQRQSQTTMVYSCPALPSIHYFTTWYFLEAFIWGPTSICHMLYCHAWGLAASPFPSSPYTSLPTFLRFHFWTFYNTLRQHTRFLLLFPQQHAPLM